MKKEERALTKGILIVFEGIDGTGKTTQLSLLKEKLRGKGLPVVTTREPTSGKYGKKIRALYQNRGNVSKQEELELFIKDRQEHVETLLQPELDEKKIILCDRYFLSTIAYQGANGFEVDELVILNDFAPRPDICFLFQLSPTKSTERITGGRGEELNDFEQEESLAQVAEIFSSLTFPFIQRVEADVTVAQLHHRILTKTTNYLSNYLR